MDQRTPLKSTRSPAIHRVNHTKSKDITQLSSFQKDSLKDGFSIVGNNHTISPKDYNKHVNNTDANAKELRTKTSSSKPRTRANTLLPGFSPSKQDASPFKDSKFEFLPPKTPEIPTKLNIKNQPLIDTNKGTMAEVLSKGKNKNKTKAKPLTVKVPIPNSVSNVLSNIKGMGDKHFFDAVISYPSPDSSEENVKLIDEISDLLSSKIQSDEDFNLESDDIKKNINFCYTYKPIEKDSFENNKTHSNMGFSLAPALKKKSLINKVLAYILECFESKNISAYIHESSSSAQTAVFKLDAPASLHKLEILNIAKKFYSTYGEILYHEFTDDFNSSSTNKNIFTPWNSETKTSIYLIVNLSENALPPRENRVKYSPDSAKEVHIISTIQNPLHFCVYCKSLDHHVSVCPVRPNCSHCHHKDHNTIECDKLTDYEQQQLFESLPSITKQRYFKIFRKIEFKQQWLQDIKETFRLSFSAVPDKLNLINQSPKRTRANLSPVETDLHVSYENVFLSPSKNVTKVISPTKKMKFNSDNAKQSPSAKSNFNIPTTTLAPPVITTNISDEPAHISTSHTVTHGSSETVQDTVNHQKASTLSTPKQKSFNLTSPTAVNEASQESNPNETSSLFVDASSDIPENQL